MTRILSEGHRWNRHAYTMARPTRTPTMARTAMRKSPLPLVSVSAPSVCAATSGERGHQSEGTEGETTPHRTSTRTFGYQRSPEPSFAFGRVGFVMLERFDHQRGAHGPNDADGPAVIQGLIEIIERRSRFAVTLGRSPAPSPSCQGRCDCTRFPPQRSIVRLGPFPPVRQGVHGREQATHDVHRESTGAGST